MLVLWEGHVVYWGAAAGALEYFARLGYECPPRTNPAEFILDLVLARAHTHPQRERENHFLTTCVYPLSESVRVNPQLVRQR